MNTPPAWRAGALALACVLAPAAHASDTADLLTGIPRLACEATLCLSSCLHPDECSPSLAHYFGIKRFNRHGLDWGATVAARHSFLAQCPVADDPGMPQRMEAIAHGAGQCDADYLNRTYANTTYKWRLRGYRYDGGTGAQVSVITQIDGLFFTNGDGHHAW